MRAEEWRACRPPPRPPTLRMYAPSHRKAPRLFQNRMQQEKVHRGRSCQDAVSTWGLGTGSRCRQPGLPIN